MVAIITANACYLCLVSAYGSSCLLQLLQLLLPNSVAGQGLFYAVKSALIVYVVSDAQSDVQVPALSYQTCLCLLSMLLC